MEFWPKVLRQLNENSSKGFSVSQKIIGKPLRYYTKLFFKNEGNNIKSTIIFKPETILYHIRKQILITEADEEGRKVAIFPVIFSNGRINKKLSDNNFRIHVILFVVEVLHPKIRNCMYISRKQTFSYNLNYS